MRIVGKQLRQVIKEEIGRALNEFDMGGLLDTDKTYREKGIVRVDLSVMGISTPQVIPVEVEFDVVQLGENFGKYMIGSLQKGINEDQFKEFMSGKPVSGTLGVAARVPTSLYEKVPFTLTRAS
jgi:hypothetical protein